MQKPRLQFIILITFSIGIILLVGMSIYNYKKDQPAKALLTVKLQNCGTAAYHYYVKLNSQKGYDKGWTQVITDTTIWMPALSDASTDGAIAVSGKNLKIKLKTTTGKLHRGYVDVTTTGGISTKITR